ncbi:MAG: ACT domain-containing protein [Lautropia sp.]|nr:ACT domain-containing protein [Lautropia sp.]
MAKISRESLDSMSVDVFVRVEEMGCVTIIYNKDRYFGEEVVACSEDDWRVFKIRGILGFDQSGVLSAICLPLGENNVSVLVVSSYDTDYIFVKKSQVHLALRCLRDAGHTIMDERV